MLPLSDLTKTLKAASLSLGDIVVVEEVLDDSASAVPARRGAARRALSLATPQPGHQRGSVRPRRARQ
jgi:hypothetical protein